jgi:ABC-type transport system involved in multi-copper enzyme maturation permease subunit
MVTSQIIFFSIVVFLVALSIILITIGHIKNEENKYATGYIIFFLTIIIGCGAIGGLVTPIGKTDVVDKSTYEMIKTERSILVETKASRIYAFRQKVDFDNITDTTTFYLDTRHNFYGFNDSHKDKFYYIKDGEKYYGDWGSIYKKIKK